MSHLPGISLENFRVFKERTDFEFAPITVLTGTNGSGKSSLIKALKLVEGNFGEIGEGPRGFWSTLDFRGKGQQLGNYDSVVNQESDHDIVRFTFPFSLDGVRDPLEITFCFEPDRTNQLKNGRLSSWFVKRLDHEKPVIEGKLLPESESNTWEFRIDFRYLRGELDAWVGEAANLMQAKKKAEAKHGKEIKESEVFEFQYPRLKIREILSSNHFSAEEIKQVTKSQKERINPDDPQEKPRRRFPKAWESRLPRAMLWQVRDLLARMDRYEGSDPFYWIYPHLAQDDFRHDHLVHNRMLPLLSGLTRVNAITTDYFRRRTAYAPHKYGVKLPVIPKDGEFSPGYEWDNELSDQWTMENGCEYYNPRLPLLAYYYLLPTAVYADWPIREQIEARLEQDFSGLPLEEALKVKLDQELSILDDLSFRIDTNQFVYEAVCSPFSLAQWLGTIVIVGWEEHAGDSMISSNGSRDYPIVAEQMGANDDLVYEPSRHHSNSFGNLNFEPVEVEEAKSELPQELASLTQNFSYFFRDFIQRNLQNRLAALHRKYGGSSHIYHLEGVRAVPSRLYTSDQNKMAIKYLADQMLGLAGHDRDKALHFLNPWVQRFGMGDRISWETFGEGFALQLFLEKGASKRPLVDHGYGYTQLLPILLQIGLIAARSYPGPREWMAGQPWHEPTDENGSLAAPSILIIEEPETNLHPKLQSLLADFFVDAAKQFRIQFILETHSEYLIRKLQYLTAKQEITPDDTAIYYFFPPDEVLPEGRKQVERLRIEADGGLDKEFGPGFFDEAVNWKIELMKLKRNRQN